MARFDGVHIHGLQSPGQVEAGAVGDHGAAPRSFEVRGGGEYAEHAPRCNFGRSKDPRSKPFRSSGTVLPGDSPAPVSGPRSVSSTKCSSGSHDLVATALKRGVTGCITDGESLDAWAAAAAGSGGELDAVSRGEPAKTTGSSLLLGRRQTLSARYGRTMDTSFHLLCFYEDMQQGTVVWCARWGAARRGRGSL
jgi:hypothetical protein